MFGHCLSASRELPQQNEELFGGSASTRAIITTVLAPEQCVAAYTPQIPIRCPCSFRVIAGAIIKSSAIRPGTCDRYETDNQI